MDEPLANLPEAPGVYLIKNTVTGRRYVGGTKNLLSRVANHFYLLSYGESNSKRMQADYDLLGKSTFSVRVLKHCLIGELNRYESFYINHFSPEYNTAHTASAVVHEQPAKKLRREAMSAMVREGKSVESVSREFGVTLATVRTACRLHGVEYSGQRMAKAS